MTTTAACTSRVTAAATAAATAAGDVTVYHHVRVDDWAVEHMGNTAFITWTSEITGSIQYKFSFTNKRHKATIDNSYYILVFYICYERSNETVG